MECWNSVTPLSHLRLVHPGFDDGWVMARMWLRNEVQKEIPISHPVFVHELKALLSVRKLS